MKIIIAIHGEQILVDDEDFEMLSKYRWHISSKGYATCSVKLPNGRYGVQRMHRMILGLEYGDKRQGDHRDSKSKLDNRRGNLRISTRSQNQMNRGRPKFGNSPLKGVKRTKQGKWSAQITVGRKNHYLGTYLTPELAHEAYKLAAVQLHGEFANFGDQS
ncbi:AP2 domain-containing protein [Paraburkholderia atlantica]|uniref:AP2 domain-containing protein n=1 Tax=Paraburkholderia atlantica TaxID=2654982 RepID=UPI0016072CDD|nr:AP2 domain-containing protein [Paraburkholderia atlantica]MBB5509595.1 hypothetical protein [Paraburkholderia atlantica]